MYCGWALNTKNQPKCVSPAFQSIHVSHSSRGFKRRIYHSVRKAVCAFLVHPINKLVQISIKENKTKKQDNNNIFFFFLKTLTGARGMPKHAHRPLVCTAEGVLCVQLMMSIHRCSSRFAAVFGDLFLPPPETSNMFRLSFRYHVLLGSAVSDNRFTRTLSPPTRKTVRLGEAYVLHIIVT